MEANIANGIDTVFDLSKKIGELQRNAEFDLYIREVGVKYITACAQAGEFNNRWHPIFSDIKSWYIDDGYITFYWSDRYDCGEFDMDVKYLREGELDAFEKECVNIGKEKDKCKEQKKAQDRRNLYKVLKKEFENE